uniref:Uncharacterized protein n=1 Tax=Pseudo-nitzschia australis TaxID=44445 RepID=A0A7S4AX32_9STRA|mmetsp:Transcript_11839/g.25059  ORF Transcript_11839/g.25059 Transcript_11839/m.25059 type:complete len:848 (+) Transcript_11839:158-2701(+)
MGKAGRRKKNRQKRKEKQAPLHGGGDSASLSSAISNPQSAVHRLRHTDPRIRHEALVALQASVLSQIRCGGGSRQVSLKVLQAVREQVTSSDLECSAVAADCLAQYLSATSSSSDNSDQQKQTTASWGLVLLGRLEDCRMALVEQQQQSQSTKTKSENQRKKALKTKNQWYAVSAPCFIALCQLIENNGHALNQINLQKKTFVEVVFGLLSLGLNLDTTGSHHGNSNSQASTMEEDMAMKDASEDLGEGGKIFAQHDMIFEELRKTTELYAARSLHSALDDNWELAEVLKDGESVNAWKTLLGGITEKKANNNASESAATLFPATTRLHLIGCLVNLYQLALYNDDRHASALWSEELLLEYGLRIDGENENHGLLMQVLFCRENQPGAFHARLSTLEDKYRKAQVLLEKQIDDQKLEAEVDAEVRERKEPAKMIARRQKKAKEAKMIAEAEADVANTDMMDADDDVVEVRTSGKITNREQDGEEAVNEAMLEWTSTTGQIQLALEIFTNLVSTWISVPEDQVADDKPMAICDASIASKSTKSKIFNLINGIDMASRLADMLQTLCQFLGEGKRKNQRDEMDDDESKGNYCEYEADDPIRVDLEETIGKVAACLINCILSGIIAATTTSNIAGNSCCPVKDVVWNSILRDLNIELNGSRNGQETPVANNAVVDAYAAVLVVVMETNPSILYQDKESPNLFQEYIALFQRLLPRRDAVCLLSWTVLKLITTIETTTTHTEAMVQSITEKFLELLAKKVDNNDTEVKTAVMNTQMQILKTFMDWYGNDNFYPQLYNKLGVSTTISSCLTSISNELNGCSVSGIDEEQMEILHNSERFIEYKKSLEQNNRL